MSATATTLSHAQRDVVVTRTFNAPRSLVFKMWTDPKHLAQWWGPHQFTNPVCEVDLRPGGKLHIVMRGPKGTPYDSDFPMSGTFEDIVPPERLVFRSIAQDGQGNAAIDCLTTVTFAEHDGKTTLTVSERGVALTPIGAQMIQGMEIGLTQTIDKLEAHIAQTH
jgi:uncharacterized protein YndB with AHSA1/START domain